MMHEDFRSLLLAAPAVSALVADRVTWGLHPQSVTDPAIALHEISAVPNYTMQGQDDMVPTRVQVDCRGISFASALALARAVRAALSGYRGAQGGTSFAGIFQLSGRSYSDKTDTQVYHIVSTDFEVWSHPAP